jgi:putative nucleotidyltransferase with HDIG domain
MNRIDRIARFPQNTDELLQMIPSIETCFLLMEKYGMLENIKAHSVVVAKIARLIAKGLEQAGVDISIEKTTAAALMHDIGKTASLKYGGDHTEIGRQICLRNHFEEIADIVREHVIFKDYELDGDYSEKEIVYYADKRVNHDRIVSLDERLVYILERYGNNQQDLCRRIKKNFKLCAKVEKKLFTKLNFRPESLSRLVEKEEIMLNI